MWSTNHGIWLDRIKSSRDQNISPTNDIHNGAPYKYASMYESVDIPFWQPENLGGHKHIKSRWLEN